MNLRACLLVFVGLCGSLGVAAQPAITCLPQERGALELVALRANFHTVSGRLGGFDPCESRVKFRLPAGVVNPPLMISVHGGGGIHDVLRSDEAFVQKGFATLAFEA